MPFDPFPARGRPHRCRRHRPRAALLAPALTLALVGTLPAGAGAQAIRGRVVAEGRAVAEATVVAVDTLGDVRARAVTDSAGRFELSLLEGGEYRVRVSHGALGGTASRPLVLAVDEELEVEIRLGPGAADTLAIVRSHRPSTSHLARYYERLERYGESGRGVFITREDLDATAARTAGQAVQLLVRRRFRPRGGGSCRPTAYWNGMRVREPWNPRQSEAADIPTSQLEGIEVYFADQMELPTEYLDEECGVILLWTRPRESAGDDRSTLLRLILFMGAAIGFFVAVAT